MAEFNSKPPEVRGSTQAVLHDKYDTACTTILISHRYQKKPRSTSAIVRARKITERMLHQCHSLLEDNRATKRITHSSAN